MAESPEFLTQSAEELAAARAETRAKFQGILADTEERKFYKVILLDLQKQMQVSQNVVRTLHSDPTFKPDKDSVAEQLMGQIRNMEDTVSSVLVALEYGPDIGTSYRLNQAVSTLKISGRKEKVKGKRQDIYDTTVKPQANLEGMDDPDFDKIISSLNKTNILNKDDILAIKNLHCMTKRLNLENRRALTNAGLLQLLGKCLATLEDLNLDGTEISGEGLESLLVLKQLEKLYLGNCKNLTNTGLLQLLAKCSATLENLNLHETFISGEGLESLPVLQQLEILNLSNCWNLTNTGLLQLLAKCSATLKVLNLGGNGAKKNYISGEGLESLPLLKQLEKLDLGYCRNLTNTGLLQLLAKCSASLKHLNLESTKISGEGLESILLLKKLETLNLQKCNKMTNTGLLQLLANCSATLKDLNLDDTGISGEGLESLPLLKLEKLDLGYCRNLTITGLLQLLAKCSATLADLSLDHTGISEEGLESLPLLKLEKLDLGYCRNLTITGLLQLLAKCSATLKDLNLCGTELYLESLPFLKQLETVNLNYCGLTNEELLELLAKYSATLKDLSLIDTEISGEGLESIPLLKQLEKLNLEKCNKMTNTGLLQFLGKCSATLKDLYLGRTEISGEGLVSLPALKQLENLYLGDCKNLTNTGLLQLLAKCSATLKVLNLGGNVNKEMGISGEGLESLPLLKQLEKLDLGYCRNLTNTGLLELLGKCSATLEDLYLWSTEISGEILADWMERHAPRKLRQLNLGACWNVSDADRERISNALPQCEVK